jgi:hypothetical protein
VDYLLILGDSDLIDVGSTKKRRKKYELSFELLSNHQLGHHLGCADEETVNLF